MPCLRQKSEMVSPLARSRSASRSNRATSSAFLRLLMGPSRTYSTQRLPFRLDQFSGSTPLLPDILVCTQVGQEEIDLHRHCPHVIHYDLGWNPAAVEQRTGRTDRIGSKAARERNNFLKNN